MFRTKRFRTGLGLKVANAASSPSFSSSHMVLEPLIFFSQAQNHPEIISCVPRDSLWLDVNPVGCEAPLHMQIIWEFKLNLVKHNVPEGDLVEIGHPKIY